MNTHLDGCLFNNVDSDGDEPHAPMIRPYSPSHSPNIHGSYNTSRGHAPTPKVHRSGRRLSLSIDIEQLKRSGPLTISSLTGHSLQLQADASRFATGPRSDPGRSLPRETRHDVDLFEKYETTTSETASSDETDSGIDVESDSFEIDPKESSHPHIPQPDLHKGELRKFTACLDRAQIEKELSGIKTYGEFKRAAKHLGDLCDFESWKNNDLPDSCDYDVEQLRRRLREAERVRQTRDPEQMIHLLRTQLSRQTSGIDDENLFHPFLHGTKTLVEEYTDSICDLIEDFAHCCLSQGNQLDMLHLKELLKRTKVSYGKTALMCSGGGTFGMRHIGTIKSLFETGNLPRVISGSSAGSIVCAVLCSKTDRNLQRVLENFCHGDLKVFIGDDEASGYCARLAYFKQNGHLFDSKNLERVMRFHLGDITFEEAYELTHRILNITVSTGTAQGPKVLHYRNSPNVLLWSAVVASCALPFTFKSCPVYIKNPKTGKIEPHDNDILYTDGSIEADIPYEAVQDEFNVNHAVVAQVNPHVVMFLEDKSAVERLRMPTYAIFLETLRQESAAWVLPVVSRKLVSIVRQKYSGHITILPKDWITDLGKVLRNPTSQFMEDAKWKGERATWERLSIIDSHTKIERALQAASDALRDAVYKET